jgi:hypothetical protein
MPRPHHWIDSQAGTICKDCFSPLWAQHGECPGNPETDALREEVTRLRAENEELRAGAPKQAAKSKPGAR